MIWPLFSIKADTDEFCKEGLPADKDRQSVIYKNRDNIKKMRLGILDVLAINKIESRLGSIEEMKVIGLSLYSW